MKRTYAINYARDGKEVTMNRVAESATDAIDKLLTQYGWSLRLNLVDADTRGNEWCSGLIDTNGGINYDMHIIAAAKR